jgi:hypothetical protein
MAVARRGTASPEHLEILREGVEAWNRWRSGHLDITPDRCGADISRVDLWMANLSKANLAMANLSGADLTGAILSEARLEDAQR